MYDDDIEVRSEEEEEAFDYDPIVDEFGFEDTQLTNYYLHRYKLFKLVPDLVTLDSDDVLVFCIIEEEIGNRQAVEQMKLENRTKG